MITDFDLTQACNFKLLYGCLAIFIFLGHPEPLALGTAPPAPSSSLLLHRTSSTPVCSMDKWINIWIWLCVFKFLLFRYKSSFNISLKFYDWKNMWFLANVYKLETQVSETYHKLSFLKSFHKTLRSHITDKQDWVISCVSEAGRTRTKSLGSHESVDEGRSLYHTCVFSPESQQEEFEDEGRSLCRGMCHRAG